MKEKRGERVNAQFKKGVLELIVLKTVFFQDRYGYELVEVVSKVVDVNEGTIYPLLKRLTNEHYFETYLKESTEGPPRKYYHITATGILHLKELEEEWLEFSGRVCDFLREQNMK
jgi:PadR family transcriptional regulator PadR